MARAANVKLKVNPPLGNMPALQWALVSQLQIDPTYQRSVEGLDSQTLIRKIAQHWNWDLCLALVVSRRPDGAMFVIDGQHRMCAARLRGDLHQLPCVVVDYAHAAAEAASFVHLNQQRRPLTRLDVFKAAVAGEDPEALAIVDAMASAGLSIAPHSNHTAWKPGMVSNIGGIEGAWRKHGPLAAADALAVLAVAFKDQVLRYAGTIFPGIVAIRAAEGEDCELGKLADMLAQRDQTVWRNAIMRARSDDPNLNFTRASEVVLAEAWLKWCDCGDLPADNVVPARRAPTPALGFSAAPLPAGDALVNFKPLDDGRSWCDQCEMRVTRAQGEACKSRYCALRMRKAG